MTTVTVPDTIEYVGNGAFSGYGLRNITLPVDLDVTGRFGMQQQYYLQIHYTPGRTGIMPDGRCPLLSSGKTASITFDEGIIRIGDHTFESSTDYKVSVGVTWPSTLKSIGVRAFAGQVWESLCLPEGVTELGEGCFDNNHFYRITYGDDISGYGDVLLPSTLEHIPDNCFSNSPNLNYVRIPGTVKTIGASAFENSCTRIGYTMELELGEGVEELGDRFIAGSTLRRVTLPASIKSMGSACFYNSPLSYVEFAGPAPTLAEDAFSNITAEVWYHPSLPSWTEDKLLNYGGRLTWKAFHDHIHEWSEVVYSWSGDCLTATAERHCLGDETHVERETVVATRAVALAPTDAEMGATTYAAAFENEAFEPQTRTETDIPALRDMALLRLPEQLRHIEADAFASLACQGIIIPDGCESIAPGAFANCEQLIYVYIPAGVSVGEGAFDGCPRVRIDPGE